MQQSNQILNDEREEVIRKGTGVWDKGWNSLKMPQVIGTEQGAD